MNRSILVASKPTAVKAPLPKAAMPKAPVAKKVPVRSPQKKPAAKSPAKKVTPQLKPSAPKVEQVTQSKTQAPKTEQKPQSDSKKFVLVFVSAKTCPACIRFKIDWGSIKSQVEKIVSIVEIEVQKPSDAKNITTPVNLGVCCSYVPILLLLPRSSVEKKTLDGCCVYGTTIKNGKALVPGAISMKPNNVIEWVKNTAK